LQSKKAFCEGVEMLRDGFEPKSGTEVSLLVVKFAEIASKHLPRALRPSFSMICELCWLKFQCYALWNGPFEPVAYRGFSGTGEQPLDKVLQENQAMVGMAR